MPDGQGDLFGLESLRRRAREPVESCRECGGKMKVYRRKLNAGMASALCRQYKLHGDEWGHLARDIGSLGRDVPTTALWGLIVQQPNDSSTTRTSGVWRLTPLGTDFVLNRQRVPSHVFLASPGNRVLGWESSQTDVVTALGNHFNYQALMGGA